MKKRWIWMVVAVVAVSGIGVAIGMPDPPPTVRTAVLQPRRVEQTISCSGVVEAGKSTPVLLPMTCVISEMWAQEGQQVKKGDTLAVVNKEATRALVGGDYGSLLALAAMEEQITAPADGIVVAVKGEAGLPLEVGTPCAVMVPRSALQIRIAIREKDLPKLKTGMAIRLRGDGLEKTTYQATLTEISYSASSSGAGAVVEGIVTLDQGQVDDSFRLGLTAKATVITHTVTDGLVVPYEAVGSDGDGTDYVYLLEDGVARRRPLQVAARLGEGLLLSNGALEGAAVILQPEQVSDGVAVLNEEADI